MGLLAKHITVTIVYDSEGIKCEAVCGLDWTSAETVATVKQRIKDRFGDIAKLEILDLSSDDKRVPELKERIRKNNLSLPGLLVNNEVRISGEFDARQLMDAIEVEREIKWKTHLT
jgi:disulfide oxidoreductase YuzD